MSFLAYGSTDQSAAFEIDGNQVSTSSSTGENTILQNNTNESHNLLGGGSEVSQTANPDGSTKAKLSGDVYM